MESMRANLGDDFFPQSFDTTKPAQEKKSISIVDVQIAKFPQGVSQLIINQYVRVTELMDEVFKYFKTRENRGSA